MSFLEILGAVASAITIIMAASWLWRWFRAWRARRRISRNRFGGAVIDTGRPWRGRGSF